jgi:predicted nucleic-acid-binding protein
VIGLDTNIVLRLLGGDDPRQSALAKALIVRESATSPVFISLATILEVAWVLRSSFRAPSAVIAAAIESLLGAGELAIEAAPQVFEATVALKAGRASFADALIGALGRRAGCTTTYTFDRKAARLASFTQLDEEERPDTSAGPSVLR